MPNPTPAQVAAMAALFGITPKGDSGGAGMTHTERMEIIKKNRRDYKHGVSLQDLDACAINGWVPDHISDKVVIGRNSLNIACHDIDYLIRRVEALSITEESK